MNKDAIEKNNEVNFKKDFCMRHFDKRAWSLDVLNKVDVLLKDRKGNKLLYIESKAGILSDAERRKALAQVILTNKKQKEILSTVALIYPDAEAKDVLEIIDCSDDSVMFNNDINWRAEKASEPSKDAIDHINNRLVGRITTFRGDDEIREAYKALKKKRVTTIQITERNVSVVYHQWKRAVVFHEYIPNEQDLINLFLVDLLNGTDYRDPVYKEMKEGPLFKNVKKNTNDADSGKRLMREGTNLLNYRLMFIEDVIDGIKYKGYPASYYYHIENSEQYEAFWHKYSRPPEKQEFMNILEHSSMLYSERYRKDTGGEYTPSCFVELQNAILRRHYNLDEFIVFDPCAGVGNLENDFGKDFKPYCYLSTLVNMDVDTCKIKGFDNAIQFDYFAQRNDQPKWKYRGEELDIREIARREGRKLMVVMNPPYVRRKGYDNDMAIEFFNKVVQLQPDVIVYYCKTEFFLRGNTVSNYVRSGYKVVSHVFSNAKDTFQLSEWAASMVVFDKQNGTPLDPLHITADRYDFDRKTQQLQFVRTYSYDNSRPDLVKEIEKEIWSHATGAVLGQWCYLNSVMKISNGGKEKRNKITTDNLQWCLLSKGLNFNTHHKYFEWNYLVYRGKVADIPTELFNDALMFALFYKGILFTNKGQRNYIMPFTAEELGYSANDLNELFVDRHADGLPFADEQPETIHFNFREFLHRFDFSTEAQALYHAALDVFRYYHRNLRYAAGRDANDSFYDVCNAIMGKDVSSFKDLDTDDDRRITRVKTTKGSQGFGRNTIGQVVDSADLPIFMRFFDARDTLATKINRMLVDHHLLLWERENIF